MIKKYTKVYTRYTSPMARLAILVCTPHAIWGVLSTLLGRRLLIQRSEGASEDQKNKNTRRYSKA